MSRYPSATWKPISGTSTKAVQKDILCFHTMVGYLGSTWKYFNRTDVLPYSHGGIGGIWGSDAAAGLDGVAWQMADTDYRAAANLDGNWRVISWETADNAERPIQPWTPKQQTKIVQVMVDAHRLDGIPLVLIPDSKPGRRGVAYHRLGCDPYRVAGGELWSSSYGKDCPTDPRIKQLPGLIDRARRIVAGGQDGGLFMALTDAEEQRVLKAADQILATAAPGTTGPSGTWEATLAAARLTFNSLNELSAQVKANQAIVGDDEAKLTAKLDEVKAAVDKLAPPAPPKA